ncbi:MAG: ChuX/HutX family heme-like substrate-binding protein [Saprospiraceae bacterium]|nr:ChuX/HutX family heme-like substrate-binding protein [Saprospiraceae bacterium]
MTVDATTLKEQYLQLKQEKPQLRIRDAAIELEVSELELLELSLGDGIVRLEGDCKEMLKDMKQLGYVMALTRNEYAVHERKGIYDNISFMAEGKMGVAVNEDIDVRFFMTQWHYAYAAKVQAGPNHTLYSFQFFNDRGHAVHKVYLTAKSEPDAYNDIVKKYRAKDQNTPTIVNKNPVNKVNELPDTDINIPAFQQDWIDLQDTHDFFGMLKKHKVTRTQAMRLAPKGYVRSLDNQAIVKMLERASERQLPIMIFVGNDGCIQIHTGQVNKIVPMEGWINVMDPEFNLHLKLGGIAEIWETRKPTKDGIVTGIEVFDAEGELIVYCFGKRKPGIPELQEWRDLVSEL